MAILRCIKYDPPGFVDRLLLAHCCPSFMRLASCSGPIAPHRTANARSYSVDREDRRGDPRSARRASTKPKRRAARAYGSARRSGRVVLAVLQPLRAAAARDDVGGECSSLEKMNDSRAYDSAPSYQPGRCKQADIDVESVGDRCESLKARRVGSTSNASRRASSALPALSSTSARSVRNRHRRKAMRPGNVLIDRDRLSNVAACSGEIAVDRARPGS